MAILLDEEKLQARSVTAGDQGQVSNGVIRLVIPYQPYGYNNLNLTPEPPGYWGQARDFALSATVYREAMWGAAVGIAITKIAALSWEIDSPSPMRAKRTQEMLLNADGARVGWVSFLSKHLRDYLCTDNGAFVEIVRQTSAATSPIVGIRHLDSRRCTRTGDPDIPVIYRDRNGAQHELKDYQVFFFSDMPDPADTYYGVGLCAASRAYPAIYKLASMEWFIREKVSGLHPLAIHVVNGLLGPQVDDAIKGAKEQAMGRGVAAYMGSVIVATGAAQPPALATIPLAELPDGFARKEEFDLAILTYANALGLDPQDLQPLTGQALGTGAQSQVLADKAGGKGLSAWRQAWTHALNNYVLADGDGFTFMEKDYRDLKSSADLSKQRADTSKVRIDAGITTPEQELQVLVDLDELPKEFLAGDDVTPGDTVSDDEKPDKETEKPETPEKPEAPDTETPEDQQETKSYETIVNAAQFPQETSVIDLVYAELSQAGRLARAALETEAFKHLQGRHNQKRHGWRYGGIGEARRSMRGLDNPDERSEYRRRAGMPKPIKRPKMEGPKPGKAIDLSVSKSDRDGWFKFPDGSYRKGDILITKLRGGYNVAAVYGKKSMSLPLSHGIISKIDDAKVIGAIMLKNVDSARYVDDPVYRKDFGDSIYKAAGMSNPYDLGGYQAFIGKYHTPVAQRPASIKPSAKGTPVSAAIDIAPRSGKIRDAAEETLNAINSVHGDGNLPKIPLEYKPSRTAYGQYQSTYSGKAVKITIAMEKEGGMHDTIAHEVGHFLDHQGLLVPGKFASHDAGSGPGYGVLKQWNSAVKNSKYFKENFGSAPIVDPSQGGAWKMAKYRAYLGQSHELFARSYAQYIALRSGNKTMMDAINLNLSKNTGIKTNWDWDDFEPIAQALDEAFASLGWR